jgi:wyosine [tRNA(Phe)-imidazoG37] synthetase (radical SAM superfamily)
MFEKQAVKKKYLFGPVASRRLGLSLGIDLVPHKTCSLNCVYCESGQSTCLTAQRAEYVPTSEVIQQLDDFLSGSPELDYLTFSGAGEPTLHSGIGEIIEFCKSKYPQYRICLLTNASMFSDSKLRREISRVDLICPSLDASNEEEFEKINRPAPGITFQSLVDGLKIFRASSEAEYRLELFIVPGVNDSNASIERFVVLIREIAPDLVQLNTLDRPGCVDWIRASVPENTMRFVNALEPYVRVEAIGPFKYRSEAPKQQLPEEEIDHRIIDLVSRRPSTLNDMTGALQVDRLLLKKHIDTLQSAGKLIVEEKERGIFYKAPAVGGA